MLSFCKILIIRLICFHYFQFSKLYTLTKGVNQVLMAGERMFANWQSKFSLLQHFFNVKKML